MFGKKFLIVLCAAIPLGAGAPSQTPAPQTTNSAAPQLTAVPDGGVPKYLKSETAEERSQRLGTSEDPGLDPDPSKHFWRFGKSFHIEKYDRRFASYEDVEPGHVRPFAYVNAVKEVYQQNDKYVWVWIQDPTPEDLLPPPPPAPRYTEEQLRFLEGMRPDFSELTPKSGDTTIRFEEASQGLPTSGSWRNSLAVADMNGDGCPDIIAPPERQSNGIPVIFLGDCKGHWTIWNDVQWPLRVDYGSVVAADFNKDGHMDLAFGVHLQGVVVMLGDGKGKFTLADKGINRDLGTRRVLVTDVDHDGYPDIVALNEGIAGNVPQAKLRVYLNRDHGTSWQPIDIAGADRPVAGDWLSVAHLKGELYPDFVASTIYMNSNDTIFMSDGPKKWKPLGAPASLLPPLGYYYATAAGKFSSKKFDDALVSFIRYWPTDLNKVTMPDPPMKSVVGVDRISFAGKLPKRTPVVRWNGTRPILGLAVGDFNGDGNLDIVYTRHDPRELVILLGDGKGGFTRANVEGVKLDPNTNYDIAVADVNGDGKPDLILMYEAMGAGSTFAPRDGSIHVFLNRGITAAQKSPRK